MKDVEALFNRKHSVLRTAELQKKREENNKMKKEELMYLFEIFNPENTYVEIRILKTNRGTISGYFNDIDKLFRAIKQYDGKYNVFFTLNPIVQDVSCRSVNHFTEWAKNTTSDKEIAHRDWILIDLDPERPAGVSSTDEELAKAESLAGKVEGFLTEQGFPEPVKCLSGNGIHLLFLIDMENTPDSAKCIKEFLAQMDKKFSNPDVKIDTTTYNAARITKLYGTMACKGDSTEDRPHRRSKIISAPEELVIVSKEQIEDIISFCAPAEAKPSEVVSGSLKEKESTAFHGTKIDVRKFCESHGLEIVREKPLDYGGTCFVLSECPWNHEHSKDTGAYIIEYANGKISAGCHHDSCKNENWWTLLKKFPDMKAYTEPHRREPSKKSNDMSVSQIVLTDIKEEGHQFFHDKGENAYVAVPLDNGHIEYMAVNDKRYKSALRRMFYKNYDKTISAKAMHQIIDTIEAEANYNSAEIIPATRCKYSNGYIYYYLADEEQTVFCIDKEGIRILEACPIPFIKRQNMLEQVMPMDRRKKKGKEKPSFRTLARKYWKFESEDDMILHNVVLLTRFISDIPAPIVYYKGDRGSAKTTSMKLDKMLVDPTYTDVKALPSSVNDVISALSGQYMICFDNVEGGITKELSNIFCISCSSGFYPKRKLYTDNETVDIHLNTRLSFSGITTISERADFLDRCICLSTKRIPASERQTVNDIVEEFKKDLPYLLYKSMKILSKAMTIYEELELSELPRMADFAKFGYAIAEAFNYGGEKFLEIYKKNQNELLEMMVEEDTILNVLIEYIRKKHHFCGKMMELRVELMKQAEDMGIDIRYLLKTENALSRKLNQSQSVLAMFNILLERGKSNGNRYIKIWQEKGEQS